MRTLFADTYDRDLIEVLERLEKYLPDSERNLDGYFQAVDAHNDALANTWFDGIDLDTWEQTVIKRLGYDHA